LISEVCRFERGRKWVSGTLKNIIEKLRTSSQFIVGLDIDGYEKSRGLWLFFDAKVSMQCPDSFRFYSISRRNLRYSISFEMVSL